MDRLVKYLTIVYIVLIILTGLSYIFLMSYNNYLESYVPETKYDLQGRQMLTEKPMNVLSYELFQGISKLTFFGFPVFLIFMSALYLAKEKEGYFKSLLIPVSYVVIVLVLSIILFLNFAEGEQGMGFIAILMQLVITLVSSLIVNGIVLAIVKNPKYIHF